VTGDVRPDVAGGDELPGPITVSPDPRRARRRWRWIQDHVGARLQRAYASLVVPAEPPERFAASGLSELSRSLATKDVGTAKAVLAEAQAIHDEPYERIDGAERRATTLQGTVAIAASAAVAGGGLLLGNASVRGEGWRVAVAVVLVAAVGALLACAVRAVGVTGRIFQFEEPGLERIVARAAATEAEALTFRAAELLRAADVADMVASIKVGLLRSAAWWFRTALFLLALLAALLCAYVVDGPPREPDARTPIMVIVPANLSVLTAQPLTARAAPSGTRRPRPGRKRCAARGCTRRVR
jgi:hypothetical protein